MSLISRSFLDTDLSFTPFFRFLDDFNNYTTRDIGELRVPTFIPRFDIQESKNSYSLQGELPGIEKRDVQIDFTDPQTINIHGRTETSYESPKGGEEGEGGKIWRSERKVGEFSRSFSFPEPVNQEGVKATMKNGVLSLEVPKAKKVPEQKKITIE
ncbi:HSP20-like chaperone [Leptodontidium sp. 2 PMI_412]|nr:HSP20-like chaperone [Leptodontidium sp. 2 PMI_412]